MAEQPISHVTQLERVVGALLQNAGQPVGDESPEFLQLCLTLEQLFKFQLQRYDYFCVNF